MEKHSTHKHNQKITERIEQDSIVLDGKGIFPKKLIIIESGKKIEYRIVKTRFGKFQLNR